MHRTFLRRLILGAAILIGLAPLSAAAVNLNDVSNLAANTGIATYTTFSGVLRQVLLDLLILAFIVGVIFVVIAGYRMVTSGGNEEQLEKAKKNLFWAVVGTALVATAWVVLAIIANVVKTGSV